MPYRSPSDPRSERRLPLLDRIAIKTKCKASWDEMVGNDVVRFCCTCSKNVYDLSAMQADEAEELLERHLATGGPLPCARIYRRPDGRVLTSECPNAETRRHLRRFGKVVAAGVAGAALLAGTVDLATRPVLGPDVVEDEIEHDQLLVMRHDLGAMAMGELGEVDAEERYDVNAALRSDERTYGDLDREGEGPARRRYVHDPDDAVINGTIALVSSGL